MDYLTLTNMPNVTFDYVIVGGGTAGLVLASRISENPNTTIAIIEAGANAEADPRVTVPGLFTSTVGSELDWGYGGVPQVIALTMNRAKRRFAYVVSDYSK